MEYIVNHVSIKNIKKRPNIKRIPKGITIHSTANIKSNSIDERAWLDNPDNKRLASWNICVDEHRAVEAIPLDEISYHAGHSIGNRDDIGIEMCESGDIAETIFNTAKLTAKLMKEYNFTVEKNLRRHYDWTAKNCPRVLNENNWQGWTFFKNLVRSYIKNDMGEDNMERFKRFEDLPQWAKHDIKLLMEEKLLVGDENGEINLSMDMVRVLVILNRTIEKFK